MLFYRFWVGRGQTQSVSMCRDMPNAGNMNVFEHEVDHVWIWADTIENAFQDMYEYAYKFWAGHKFRYCGWITGNSFPEKVSGGKYRLI